MRKTLFKWHSYIGLFSVLPLFLISLTGSLLVFKYELDTLLRGDMVSVAQVEERLPLDDLIGVVNTVHQDHEIVGWVLFQNPERSDVVYLMPIGSSDWYHIYLDGYTGAILSEPGTATTYFTDWLVELHASFLLGDTGLIIVFVYSLLLIVLGVSGLILHRKFWRNLFKLRTQARRILYYSDLHKLLGAWGSPILLILGITGGYWNVAHVLHEMEHHEEEHFVMEHRMYSNDISFDGLMADAPSRVAGFETTYIRFPNEADDQIALYGDVPDTNFLTSQYASSITYDRDSGEYLSHIDIREASALRVFLDTFRQLHFGTFAGVTSRIIWLVVGFFPIVLGCSGLYLWLKRRRARKAKQQRLQKQIEASMNS